MNQGSIETFFTWRQKIAVKNIQNSSRTFYFEKNHCFNIKKD
jgi:hypothetical protein